MSTDNEILLDFYVSKKQNSDDFPNILIDKLSEVPVKEKKRLVLCAIELIQNTIIHNDRQNINVIIYKNGHSYCIETKQVIENIETANKLQANIDIINTTNTAELKKIYKKNIISNIEKNNAGNGLILCKLRFGNIAYKYENHIFMITLKS